MFLYDIYYINNWIDKMKKQVLTLTLVIFLTFATLVSTVTSIQIQTTSLSSTTWYVDDDGSEEFTSIQEAINASSNADTVFVKNGTYIENIVINKSIKLVGESKEGTIIDPLTVIVEADEVDISNLGFHPIKNNTFMILKTNN